MSKKIVLLVLAILLLGTFSYVIYPGTINGLAIKPKGETADLEKGIKSILRDKGMGKRLEKPLLYVSKSKLTLTLYDGDLPLKSYSIAMGENYGEGTKEREGDCRTPEGRYYIYEKRIVFPPKKFLGSRWLGVSYPEKKDVEMGYEKQIINEDEYVKLMDLAEKGEILPQKTPLGGEIGIHGGHLFGKETTWTFGCIGLTNRDVEEIYNYIPVGTPIVIMP